MWCVGVFVCVCVGGGGSYLVHGHDDLYFYRGLDPRKENEGIIFLLCYSFHPGLLKLFISVSLKFQFSFRFVLCIFKLCLN